MSTFETITVSHPDEDHAPNVESALRRAPRITQADVFRTADELLVDGHRPTIDRVRMKLGRGSPNTINDHLDVWWVKLGSRLRDLPDRQFPELPERVAAMLQQLWNEALDGAHEALRTSMAAQEAAWAEREQRLAVRMTQLADEERAALGRTAALEENLALACSQLTEANRRAGALEEALRERDGALVRARARLDKVEVEHNELTQKFESERATHVAERGRLEERHAATESRWLAEIDRTRQTLKEEERHAKSLQAQVVELQGSRERTRVELSNLRAELGTALAIRTQLEERIRLLSRAPGKANVKNTARRGPARRAGAPRKPRSAPAL